jgi:hypothetical protein
MAITNHGRLGAADLAATTNTILYTVPTGRRATVNISLANRTTADIAVRLAHEDGSSGTPANEDYLWYDYLLPANTAAERTGVPVAAGNSLVAYAAAVGVSVVVQGIEETV